jgi:hypothetical protein
VRRVGCWRVEGYLSLTYLTVCKCAAVFSLSRPGTPWPKTAWSSSSSTSPSATSGGKPTSFPAPWPVEEVRYQWHSGIEFWLRNYTRAFLKWILRLVWSFKKLRSNLRHLTVHLGHSGAGWGCICPYSGRRVKTPFTLSQTLKTCLHVLSILLESESESESESLKSESESEFGILHYFFLWKAQECVPPNIGFPP